MKLARTQLLTALTACIGLGSGIAAAQTAPTQGAPPQQGSQAVPNRGSYPPAPGTPQPGTAPAAYPTQPQGAAQQQGYPQQGSPQQGDPQQAQGMKARGLPEPYYPPQGGALQQPASFGPGINLGSSSGQQGGALGETEEKRADDFGHHGQLNFRAEFLTGYRMLYRYQPSPRCAPYDAKKGPNDQQKFCGYGSAPVVGMAVGFSLVDFFEPFAFIRLGLANEAVETNQGKLMQAGIGARLYTMAESHFKVFFSPWVGIDATAGPLEPIGSGTPGTPGYDDALAKVKTGSYKTDVLAHFDLGPQYDFSRGFGVYLAGGMTFQMVRYFGMSADVAIGLQARAP
jgi:hypothetical protein